MRGQNGPPGWVDGGVELWRWGIGQVLPFGNDLLSNRKFEGACTNRYLVKPWESGTGESDEPEGLAQCSDEQRPPSTPPRPTSLKGSHKLVSRGCGSDRSGAPRPTPGNGPPRQLCEPFRLVVLPFGPIDGRCPSLRCGSPSGSSRNRSSATTPRRSRSIGGPRHSGCHQGPAMIRECAPSSSTSPIDGGRGPVIPGAGNPGSQAAVPVLDHEVFEAAEMEAQAHRGPRGSGAGQGSPARSPIGSPPSPRRRSGCSPLRRPDAGP